MDIVKISILGGNMLADLKRRVMNDVPNTMNWRYQRSNKSRRQKSVAKRKIRSLQSQMQEIITEIT